MTSLDTKKAFMSKLLFLIAGKYIATNAGEKLKLFGVEIKH
jgi:hypothetical protein